jgi:DNA polymerase-3 subunit gamma/tau
VRYQALYRKYRPQRFDQIVGQDHVTLTLQREVMEDKVSHAYLFAGPRGTGKTTTARMLAKALNCTDRGSDGEPCNQCGSCVAITDGTSLDVIELDAASHNKVEDIREMRVNITTVASVSGAKRVYILDEAHMLSRAAANALLKTLEEPPDHVHFVLATTEPYKLLDTVRSRSQRFDFHPIGVELLSSYLAEIGVREGYTSTTEGLNAIARHARGSVRDGLSLIEQVAALGDGGVDERGVARALGLATGDAFARLAGVVADQDVKTGLELIAEIAAQGADLRRFVSDAIAYFRGIFLAHYAPNLEEIVDEAPDTVESWRRAARQLRAASVIQAIDQLSEALLQLREGREERLVTELAIIRITRQETAFDATSLAARLDRIEQRLRHTPAPAAPTEGEDDDTGGDQDEESHLALESADVPEPAPSSGAAHFDPARFDIAAAEEAWPAIVGGLRQEAGVRKHTILREAEPLRVEGSTLVLGVAPHLTFHLEFLLEDQDLRKLVEEAASAHLGGGVTIAYEPMEEAGAAPEVTPLRAPDKEQLVEAGDGGVDAEELVKDLLGGEVVE